MATAAGPPRCTCRVGCTPHDGLQCSGHPGARQCRSRWAAPAGRCCLLCAWGVAGRFGLALQACVLFLPRVTAAAGLPECLAPELAACLTCRVAAHTCMRMCRPAGPPAPLPDLRLFILLRPPCSARLQRADRGQPGPPQLRHAGALCTSLHCRQGPLTCWRFDLVGGGSLVRTATCDRLPTDVHRAC